MSPFAHATPSRWIAVWLLATGAIVSAYGPHALAQQSIQGSNAAVSRLPVTSGHQAIVQPALAPRLPTRTTTLPLTSTPATPKPTASESTSSPRPPVTQRLATTSPTAKLPTAKLQTAQLPTKTITARQPTVPSSRPPIRQLAGKLFPKSIDEPQRLPPTGSAKPLFTPTSQAKQQPGNSSRPTGVGSQISASSVQQVAFHEQHGVTTCSQCGKSRSGKQSGERCQCAHALGVGEFTDEYETQLAKTTYLDREQELVGVPRDAMAGFVPWWQPRIGVAQRPDSNILPMTLDEVIVQAVQNSHYIRAQSNLPLMSEQAIMEAAAEFDVHAFTQSRFTRTNEPIGNTLVTGPGRDRFLDNNWLHNTGVRKRTVKGGALEIAQRYGYQKNNSDFLVPNPQSTTQLALRFSQPLLRGSGTVYNTSVILLAQLDKNIAWDQFSRELQDHLVDVSNAYWELYLQRAVLLQRQRHFQRAKEILRELETRADIDAARSQIVRAQSAVAARQSDLARAHAAVRNSQVRLRALVNMPELNDQEMEFVPNEQPNPDFIDVGLQDALVTALSNRPEIDEAMQQLRSARVQVAITQHELLPVLDLVTETYVSGLRSDASVGPAWVDQFSVGAPSYSVGVEIEVPLHNRAAKARNRRKKLQLMWVISRYKDTLANLTSEVEIVVRDVHTAYDEMCGKYHAMKATMTELDYLTDRWHLLPGDDRSASFLLEDILDIQDRLVGHEFELARTQVAYTQSLVDLKRATGTLLEAEQVTLGRTCECGIPQLYLSKPDQPAGDQSYPLSAGSVVEPAYEPMLGEPLISGPNLSAPVVEPARTGMEALPPVNDLPNPATKLKLEPIRIPDPT